MEAKNVRKGNGVEAMAGHTAIDCAGYARDPGRGCAAAEPVVDHRLPVSAEAETPRELGNAPADGHGLRHGRPVDRPLVRISVRHGRTFTDREDGCNRFSDRPEVGGGPLKFGPMDKQSVGTRLIQLRKSFGLTQRELADRMGLRGKSRVSNYEAGDNYPSFEFVDDLSSLLGVDAFALLTGDQIFGAAEDGTRHMPGHVSFSRLLSFSKAEEPRAAILPEAVISRRMPNADLASVRWVTNPTEAMSPRYAEGAMTFIDVRVNSLETIVNGQAHALHIFGRPDVRRVFDLGRNEYLLTGDDERSFRHELTRQDYKKLEIFGRVIDAI